MQPFWQWLKVLMLVNITLTGSEKKGTFHDCHEWTFFNTNPFFSSQILTVYFATSYEFPV